MTKHLTDREIVAAADRTLAADRHRHTETCAACAAAVLACLRAVEEARTAGDVPEPSPLFWDHFSARVRAATDPQPIPSAAGWTAWWRPLVVGAAMVAGVIAGVQWLGPDNPAAPAVAERQAPPVEIAPVDEPASIDDSDWDAVAAMASSLDAATVESMAPTPVATTPLVEDLTSRELQEFARLLRAEMGGAQ